MRSTHLLVCGLAAAATPGARLHAALRRVGVDKTHSGTGENFREFLNHFGEMNREHRAEWRSDGGARLHAARTRTLRRVLRRLRR